MIPSNFQYHKASSVEEALKLLQEYGDDAKLLAGGHSLIPSMKLRLSAPEHLVDISKIDALRSISQDGDELVIGACCTHGEIAQSELVQKSIGMLAQASGNIGDIQVRNFGTIGGSLVHADPSADWPALFLAADGKAVLQSASGSRTVSGSEFLTGFFETAIEENEILTEIRFPMPAAHTSSAYAKFEQPASRYAIVGAAAMITRSNGTIERVKLALTGLSDNAFRDTGVEEALAGKEYNEANIEAAVAMAGAGRSVLSDHFASEDYRLHVARVYAKRALLAAQ